MRSDILDAFFGLVPAGAYPRERRLVIRVQTSMAILVAVVALALRPIRPQLRHLLATSCRRRFLIEPTLMALYSPKFWMDWSSDSMIGSF
jgi:hypothetical protein